MSTSFRVCVSKHTLTVSRFKTASVISPLLFHLQLSDKLKTTLALLLDKPVAEASAVVVWSFGYGS